MMPKLRCIMVDNFDSFTYNIVQYLQMLEVEVEVVRSDIEVAPHLATAKPDFVVLSPGPSHPKDAPGSLASIAYSLQHRLPLLGVCLGHQCIAHYLGGTVKEAPTPVHGKPAEVYHHGGPLFASIPSPIRVARYHSLVVDRHQLPDSLAVTSELADGLVMSLAHRNHPMVGVQFHPESIISEHGLTLLQNFINSYVSR